jgi:hypothetical protein
MLGVQLTLLLLVLLFYGMRIYSRSRPNPHFMWDDFFITMAMVSTLEKNHTP